VSAQLEEKGLLSLPTTGTTRFGLRDRRYVQHEHPEFVAIGEHLRRLVLDHNEVEPDAVASLLLFAWTSRVWSFGAPVAAGLYQFFTPAEYPQLTALLRSLRWGNATLATHMPPDLYEAPRAFAVVVHHADHADHADHPPSSSAQFDAFWSLTHHTVFWLDFNLTGSLEGFTPPTPFTVDAEGAPERLPPAQPYTREELHVHPVQLRQKCQTTLLALSDEQAHIQAVFPWLGKAPLSFGELLLLSTRHVQEHAAQLSLFLGQHAVPDEALDWVPRAKDEPGSH
jgi:hypothetical protein